MKKTTVFIIIILLIYVSVNFTSLQNGFSTLNNNVTEINNVLISNNDTVIESYEQWVNELNKAKDNLEPIIKLKIKNYTDSVYDIKNFESGKYTIFSTGTQIGNTAVMEYKFEYGDSYMITKAIENPKLKAKLSQRQQGAIDHLVQIKNQIIYDYMNDYEKELAIHDYLTKNYSYNSQLITDKRPKDENTGISAFLETKSGICEAYAYTFKALCNLSGLECYITTGIFNGDRHAWNTVKINGDFYNIDVTADDPVPDEPNHCYYSYFNLTDAEIEKTHTPDNKTVSCTADKYNYFKYNNLIVNNKESFKIMVNEQLNIGKTSFVFKTQGYAVNDRDINEVLSNKGFTSYRIVGDMTDKNGSFELRLY